MLLFGDGVIGREFVALGGRVFGLGSERGIRI